MDVVNGFEERFLSNFKSRRARQSAYSIKRERGASMSGPRAFTEFNTINYYEQGQP